MELDTFALFGSDGLPVGFWRGDVFPASAPDARNPAIPDDAVKISDMHWREFISNPGRRKWNGEKPVAYTPPEPPLPPRRYSKKALFEAMTDAEYETFESTEAGQSARDRRVFREATELDERDPGFAKVLGLMNAVYGEARAAELLSKARL